MTEANLKPCYANTGLGNTEGLQTAFVNALRGRASALLISLI